MGNVLGRLLKEQLGGMKLVGDIRGRGLFWAIEFMEDPISMKPFQPGTKFCDKVVDRALELGLNILGNLGVTGDTYIEHVIMSPPYVVTESELHRMVCILRQSVEEVSAQYLQQMPRSTFAFTNEVEARL